MIDYHIHTPLCNHATGQMEQYIQQAIQLELKEICFLDHLILHGAGNPSSMAIEEVALYFNALRRLQRQYRDTIMIKIGLEVDFDPHNMALIEAIINRFAFDVIASSVHFIENKNIMSRNAHTAGKRTCDLTEKYIDQLNAMLAFDYFDIICHMDVIKKFHAKASLLGWNNEYEKKIDAILTKISYKGVTVEINTSGFTHPVKECYPSLALLRKCNQKNITITLGSDAHRPRNVGQYFDDAFRIAHSAGYSHLSVFSNRKRHSIKIG